MYIRVGQSLRILELDIQFDNYKIKFIVEFIVRFIFFSYSFKINLKYKNKKNNLLRKMIYWLNQ